MQKVWKNASFRFLLDPSLGRERVWENAFFLFPIYMLSDRTSFTRPKLCSFSSSSPSPHLICIEIPSRSSYFFFFLLHLSALERVFLSLLQPEAADSKKFLQKEKRLFASFKCVHVSQIVDYFCLFPSQKHQLDIQNWRILTVCAVRENIKSAQMLFLYCHATPSWPRHQKRDFLTC